MVDGGECDRVVPSKLLMMRQQRSMTGKDSDRIERVWLITDREPLPIVLMREYEGTHFVRAPLQALREFLVLPDGPDAQLQDHIWLIDPRGNLMLRWPKDPEINGVKRDIAKLLKVVRRTGSGSTLRARKRAMTVARRSCGSRSWASRSRRCRSSTCGARATRASSASWHGSPRF